MFEFIKKYFKKETKKPTYKCGMCNETFYHDPLVNGVRIDNKLVRVCDSCHREFKNRECK